MPDKIAIAMVTTDRSVKKRKNYVFDTLKQLEAAGVFSSPYYDSLTIHVDSANQSFVDSIQKSVKYHEAVYVRAHKESAGSAGNALQAHKESCQKNVDWVMTLEDDLLITENFLESVMTWMKAAYDEKRRVYQLGVWTEYVDHYKSNGTSLWFDFYGHNEPREKIFTLDEPTELMRGSQCYLMRREDSKKFADFIESIMREKKVDHLIHHDMRIRQWLNSLVKETGDKSIGLLRSPKPFSFVQHVGIESSVYDVKKHIDPAFYFQARNYP